MKSQKDKKKKLLTATAGLLVVAAVSGTFAWNTFNSEYVNRFKTTTISDGSVQVVENFESPENWVPGTDVTKEVVVSNTGSTDIFARVSLEEVLEVYKNGAKTKQDTAPFNPTTPANGFEYPVKYSTDTTGYKDVTGQAKFDDGSALPAGLKVFVKESLSQGKITCTYVYFYEYDAANSLNQKVTISSKVSRTGSTTVNDPAAAYTIKKADLKYEYYDGRQIIATDWANNPNTLFGKTGVASNGEAYDYTGFAAPTVTIPAAGQFPNAVVGTPAANIGTATADYNLVDSSGAAAGQKITINYGADVLTTMTDNKWFYDDASGYFYYMGVIEPGNSTPKMMNSVKLAGDAGEAYSDMKFDLNVEMEAIAGVKAALTDAAGWGLTAGSPLVNKLESYAKQ